MRILILGLMLSSAPAWCAFRAGAAKVDITPAPDAALPMSGYGGRDGGFEGIYDHLFVRALMVDDGVEQGIIAIGDLVEVPEKLWARLVARIESEFKIPARNVLIAGTHTHGGPSLGFTSGNKTNPKVAAYAEDVEKKFLQAAPEARANLQPARFGAGSGKANVNGNRRARQANGGVWLGRNPEGPSDKTVAVVKFESLSGEPIAILMNYGVHGTVFGPKNLRLTADLPGASSVHVEKHYGPRMVAIFSSGAAGDQNPLYNRAEKYDEVVVLGQILGDEVIRVADKLRMSTNARLSGMQTTVSCPGQKAVGERRGQVEYKFEDAAPVSIRLSLLMINHVAITGVSGEVLTMIAQRLKKESPFTQTIMVTLCNGYISYIPDDAAYDVVSYEIVSSRLKRGCAENAIVNGLVEMMDRVAQR